MTHIKKYWWAYALLIIVIIWGMKKPSCPEIDLGTGGTCPNNFQRLFNEPIKNTTNNYPNPVNGKCPQGYTLIQPNCLLAPCPASCFPLGDIDINS